MQLGDRGGEDLGMAVDGFADDPRFLDPSFDPFEASETGFGYLGCVTF
jgi:hypothetical protein